MIGMSKKGLDEMQLSKRNKIGNQSFLLLMYLLLIDAGLYGFGLRWVSYPANIVLILTVCSGIYVIRLIKSNSYIGPLTGKEKPILKVTINILIAVVVAIVSIFLIKRSSFISTTQLDDMSAPILFITATIAIVILLVTSIIRQIQNKRDIE